MPSSPQVIRQVAELQTLADQELVEAAAAVEKQYGSAPEWAALVLVDKLSRTRSESVQAHMVAALAHLGGLLGGASTVPVNFHLTAVAAAVVAAATTTARAASTSSFTT